MKKALSALFLIFLIITLSNVFSACSDDEKFSTNPSHLLVFSQDTIGLDTVFTTIGSSTYTLKVYNRNADNLRIGSVSLTDGSVGFRLNVDGEGGEGMTSFSDVEIRKGDSLYIFIEVTVKYLSKNEPTLMKDDILFRMESGVEQKVALLAYGQDMSPLHGKTITQDTTFTADLPILIYDSLRVNEGVTLTLDEGTRLYFHGKSDVRIHGTLNANGSQGKPVVFRGDRMDWMFNDLPYDRVPGQWGGLRFYGTSYDNHLDFVDIHGGQYAISCDSSDVEKQKLTLTNSILHNVKGNLLEVASCKINVGNSQLTNAEKNCVELLGGESEFIHCTIANFYSWGVRKGSAVTVKNVNNGIDYPLIKADFLNCLITGSASDELSGSKSDNSEIEFNYNFFYSLINTKLDENDPEYSEQLTHYAGSLWDDKKDESNVSQAKERNFFYIGKTDYNYDFRLDSVSAAINLGLKEYTERYPYLVNDLQGRPRLTEDNVPDAGCYEWLPGDK